MALYFLESRSPSPFQQEVHGQYVLEMIKDISSEIKDNQNSSANMPRTPINVGAGRLEFLKSDFKIFGVM